MKTILGKKAIEALSNRMVRIVSAGDEELVLDVGGDVILLLPTDDEGLAYIHYGVAPAPKKRKRPDDTEE